MSFNDIFYKNKVVPYLIYEVEASKRISKLFNVEIIKFNDNNKYDFKDSNKIKYEVKADLFSLKTNNFYVEYAGYGKPSGIKTTEAKYYIITDGNNYYMIETILLLKLCHTFGKIKITKDKLTHGYCIIKNIIISNSQII